MFYPNVDAKINDKLKQSEVIQKRADIAESVIVDPLIEKINKKIGNKPGASFV